MISFRLDDLTGEPTCALVRRHLEGMYATSPPESVHALGIDRLRQPGIRVWSAWVDGEIAAIGALKQLDGARGEIKSMRVADAYLGQGIGGAMLRHIMSEARRLGLTSLWLETGTTETFVPAITLYERAGFERCGPFEDYQADPFSLFMTRAI